MLNKTGALKLQERVSYLSADRTKEDADGTYVDAKTPGDLEDGALREGGAPVYTSPEVLALLAQYFAVGLLYGSLPSVPYNILVQYFHLTGTQYTSAKALISLGWSLKVFVGMLSDVCPIMGYRRKSYMLLGWFCAATTLLVLGCMKHGEPYDKTRPGGKLNPENIEVNSRGSTIGLLCALATISYILLMCHRMPWWSNTLNVNLNMCVAYNGDFTWDMGLNGFFIMLAVPSCLIMIITYLYINDPKKPAIV
ncbi:unnamed protein product [Aphanomyces euteiches]